jgi:transposase
MSSREWERVKDLLPPERTGRPGRPSINNQATLNGILWKVKSGATWRDIPERYGSWSTVYDRFSKWSESNLIEKVFKALEVDINNIDK